MTVKHDDLPHPVPPIAYLRYKENWFFLILDQENEIFGAMHVVSEPGFERIRFASHISVKGELFEHKSEIPFPSTFAFSPELGDGTLTVRFVKAHEQIDVALVNEDMDLRISFLKRGPLFDFADFDHANPDKVSLKEVMTFATNQQHVHQQQGMLTRGKVTMRRGHNAGTAYSIDAFGYRDHSRSIRCDNMVMRHCWNGMHFPRHIFGAMSVTSLVRPTSPTACGYVFDESGGLRSLRDVGIEYLGASSRLPESVEFCLTDIFGQPFTIVADISRRLAHVPLVTEKPGGSPYTYEIVENFVPLMLKETGEAGIGLVEIGWSGGRNTS